MVTRELVERLKLPAYEFLKSDPHLSDNIILLTIAGSVAHGTSLPTSDFDLRGVTVELTSDIMGLSHFEQFEDRQTDTVIFGLKKFVRLCLNSNPNMLEILGADRENIVIISKEGELLRDNSNLFLSKKVIESYGNYAASQLKKLQQTLALPTALQSEQEQARLLKHAMHLVRLLITGRHILENSAIKPLQERERELLRAIRLGHYSYEQIFSLVKDLESDFGSAALSTQLPHQPDYDNVQKLLISLYQARLCSH